MLVAQGLWAGMALYRARPTVTRGLASVDHEFSCLIQKIAHEASYDTQWDMEDLF